VKRIAVLTSGGDAPGMNAAVRAVVRAGVQCGYEVFGVRDGYAGLLRGQFVALGPRDVGGIIQQGGTMLGTSRCPEFKSEEYRQHAVRHLMQQDIAHVVVVGGNGSQSGANALAQMGVRVVGIASTIDNDLIGTDITIGAMTALDVALESVDRLRVTAASLHRVFIVEVMGRHCGFLAAHTAIAGGAEVLVVPEIETTPQHVAAQLAASRARGKQHQIIVVAEGASCTAELLGEYFEANADKQFADVRVTRLGHVQRGGAPNVYDRILASRLGVAAVESIVAGKTNVLMGVSGDNVMATPLIEVAGKSKQLDKRLVEMAYSLAQ